MNFPRTSAPPPPPPHLHSPPRTPHRPPEAPPAVTEFEATADQGGWHDETSWLLLFDAECGALWASTSDNPLGCGALVLVPLAVLVWLAAMRQGEKRERLHAEALTYAREVAAAQAAGARAPELSEALRELLDHRGL